MVETKNGSLPEKQAHQNKMLQLAVVSTSEVPRRVGFAWLPQGSLTLLRQFHSRVKHEWSWMKLISNVMRFQCHWRPPDHCASMHASCILVILLPFLMLLFLLCPNIAASPMEMKHLHIIVFSFEILYLACLLWPHNQHLSKLRQNGMVRYGSLWYATWTFPCVPPSSWGSHRITNQV